MPSSAARPPAISSTAETGPDRHHKDNLDIVQMVRDHRHRDVGMDRYPDPRTRGCDHIHDLARVVDDLRME